MTGRDRDPTRSDSHRSLRADVYGHLLHEAHDVAARAVERLRSLRARFPSEVPESAVAQLERDCARPGAERRASVRLEAGSEPVIVRLGPRPSPPLVARLLDRSARGVSIRIARPVRSGAVVELRLPAGGEALVSVPAQVRHCRPAPDGVGWVAGCEFVGDRPPG